MRRVPALVSVVLVAALAAAPAGAADGEGRTSLDGGREATTTLMSRSSVVGAEGDRFSSAANVSSDGRFVAFSSSSSNLVPGMTGLFKSDVFVHDRATGVVERVSVNDLGQEGSASSGSPSISADGRFVAFNSLARNLVPDDTNNARDIFVRDRLNGTTERVSVNSEGEQACCGLAGFSGGGAISADGRYVVFTSLAANLVDGYDRGIQTDVYRHDRETGETVIVSVAHDGAFGDERSSGASVSADGRFVAFLSHATNLLPFSTPGLRNTFIADIYVRDVAAGTVERVSVASDGAEGNRRVGTSSISGDGRFVAFSSNADNLVPGDTNESSDVFVHDRDTGTTARISVASDDTQGNGSSGGPHISGDGRYIAFVSRSDNLVPEVSRSGTSDVYLHDRQTQVTTKESVSTEGEEANGSSNLGGISPDGRHIVFHSLARNLTPDQVGQVGQGRQVFVRDLDATRCLDGTSPDGVLSGPVHGIADPADGTPGAALTRTAACAAADAGG